jgi:hypothetical protein
MGLVGWSVGWLVGWLVGYLVSQSVVTLFLHFQLNLYFLFNCVLYDCVICFTIYLNLSHILYSFEI